MTPSNLQKIRIVFVLVLLSIYRMLLQAKLEVSDSQPAYPPRRTRAQSEKSTWTAQLSHDVPSRNPPWPGMALMLNTPHKLYSL